MAISVPRTVYRSIASLMIAASALLLAFPIAHGEEKASSLLDNLQRRSAEERWQRVKKQYPSSDVPGPVAGTPPLLSQSQGQSDDPVPPSPEQTPLIPRLSALPGEGSTDWIRAARNPALEDAKADGTETAKVPDPSTSDKDSVSRDQTNAKDDNVNDADANSTRPLRERKIADITPFYDRDRDKDIREFAIVKGNELGILFKPRIFYDRSFPELCMPWEPSNFFHHPLYFQDPALERYGHTPGHLIQPVASIARFGGQFILLPYQMTIDPPCKDEYSLGWYRPGDCAPKLHYQLPLNAEAAVVEAAAITGLYFLIIQ